MHSSLPDEVKIAQSELYQYLEQQVSAIAPELTPLVPVPIRVERVGFTRNASNISRRSPLSTERSGVEWGAERAVVVKRRLPINCRVSPETEYSL